MDSRAPVMVSPHLGVCDLDVYRAFAAQFDKLGYYILHAAKEPFHRSFVGYSGNGAPKDSPEYLFARRGNRLALNMIDPPKSEWLPDAIWAKALEFIDEAKEAGKPCIVHCNQGQSRAPAIAMLWMGQPGRDLDDLPFNRALPRFCSAYYPEFLPGMGVYGWLETNWPTKRLRETA